MDRANKIDPKALRLSQGFHQASCLRKHITNIPVCKPSRQDFVRIHPSSHYHIDTAVVELKDERETFLLSPSLVTELRGLWVPKTLITYINRQGVLALWPIRLPGEDGRLDSWNASATEAAHLAVENWVRVSSNMSQGAYDVYVATGEIPDPEWPEMTFEEILNIAFKSHIIDDLKHPVIKRLLGAA
ncbi:hypothetical protein XMG59_001157 [Marinobacterium sp. xm-g-59]|uniref:hypothetical protein n=1 Tax=Marinobacterium sp. xm-g-59 TaxID=2497748 RepID=UPI0015689A90|nr:hypothetical protein [Marinobacterium sp. xm-g-59]NRP95061.1 hypothetical protein [Marinobacterium sp. xm-g-59]